MVFDTRILLINGGKQRSLAIVNRLGLAQGANLAITCGTLSHWFRDPGHRCQIRIRSGRIL